MFEYSENYYLRKCYFRKQQVPTQSVMKDKMKPILAKVYFKSMNHKLKKLAGFEPRLKGGGNDWYQPPKELLNGRAVMKPIKNDHIKKLSFLGIDAFGEKLLANHHKNMEDEKQNTIVDNDNKWKKHIIETCEKLRQHYSDTAAKNNTENIKEAFQEFSVLYTSSINHIEKILFEAAEHEIKTAQDETYEILKEKYHKKLKQQATLLYDNYTEKLEHEKLELKNEFVKKIEMCRTNTLEYIHDINLEKHTAIEKLRQLMESQNLACQVYVALKERQECSKEMELSKHDHKKVVKGLAEQLAMKNFEVRLEITKEKKRQEFINIWKKKVCHVVKRFQVFVKYCLMTLPEHAIFFMDIEKLMMSQLEEAVENPSVESLFVVENETFHTPIARPHPYYLFCDKGYKPEIDQSLCPKHCTSSASKLPVIVVNKRLIYAACDKYEVFTNKIKDFIDGQKGDEQDVRDDHDYKNDVPFQITDSQRIMDLQLESSLMKIIQNEIPNLDNVPIECCLCRIPYCFCSPTQATKLSFLKQESTHLEVSATVPSVIEIKERCDELEFEREPNWYSYFQFVQPNCKCAKTTKHHLLEHIPPYMRYTSIFEAAELPTYETCNLLTLRKLCKKARGKKPIPSPSKVESRTRNVSTQYSDQEFESICQCFSNDELMNLCHDIIKGNKIPNTNNFNLVGDIISNTHLQDKPSSFATEKAFDLRAILKEDPELEDIFKNSNCNFTNEGHLQ